MSRLWPHPPFAEDQPYARSILSTHVLTRAVQTGSLIGALISTDIYLLARLTHHFHILPRLQKRLPPPSSPFLRPLLRSTGIGAVVGIGIVSCGLVGRMWGRQEIEWQDRSWRLLENKGQVECDDWTYPGMAVGLAGVLGSGGAAMGWRGVVGGMGLGSLGGMVGYMWWRYGVKGGKFDGEL